MESFDLVVIGSGPAGEKGATQAAYYGKRVAVVEQTERPGGAPVNSGGLPTKTLRETALYLSSFRRREIYGVGLDLSPEFNLERLRTRAAAVSEKAGEAVRLNLLRHGIELVGGTATLINKGEVRVDAMEGERSLQGEVILIATGSRPFHPPGVPFDDPDVYDSDTILTFDRIPGTLLVIGAGPVGCEYASIFAALGVKVTIVDVADRVVPFLDVEVSGELASCLTDMGMRLMLGSSQAEVVRHHGRLQVTVSGETVTPDMVLFAAGRTGNTQGLGLEDVGVAVDPRGRIVVDDEYRTTVESVFAAGDVIGPPALGSVSAEQGRVAVCHAFDIPFKETVDPLPPYAIYTSPEVGVVGMSEEMAAAAGIDYEVGRHRFVENPKSIIAGTTQGLVKLVFRRDNRRLLGVHILGEEAAELVHVGQAVIHAAESIDRFIHTTFNIPTRAEAYKYAAYDGLQRLASRFPGDRGQIREGVGSAPY
jgi:NAD(P) transhydrogenase